MTAPIGPIAAISPLTLTPQSAAVTGTGGGSGASFATALGNGLDALDGAQDRANGLAVQAATGQLTDPARYTIAATEATLMTQLATTIENKAVTAFNTVMGMQA